MEKNLIDKSDYQISKNIRTALSLTHGESSFSSLEKSLSDCAAEALFESYRKKYFEMIGFSAKSISQSGVYLECYDVKKTVTLDENSMFKSQKGISFVMKKEEIIRNIFVKNVLRRSGENFESVERNMTIGSNLVKMFDDDCKKSELYLGFDGVDIDEMKEISFFCSISDKFDRIATELLCEYEFLYFNGDEFSKANIIYDGTHGFQKSGEIELHLDSPIKKKNIAENSSYYIMIRPKGKLYRIPEVGKFLTNVIEVLPQESVPQDFLLDIGEFSGVDADKNFYFTNISRYSSEYSDWTGGIASEFKQHLKSMKLSLVEILKKAYGSQLKRVSVANLSEGNKKNVCIVIEPNSTEKNAVFDEDSTNKIADYLEKYRTIGVKLTLKSPVYLPITIKGVVYSDHRETSVNITGKLREVSEKLIESKKYGESVTENEFFIEFSRIRGVKSVEKLDVFFGNTAEKFPEIGYDTLVFLDELDVVVREM